MKTAVVAISTGCLDYLNIKNDNLYMLRCKIILEGKSYDDYVDMDANTFYEKIKADKSLLPSSSMPSIGEIETLFETLEKKQYKQVLVLTISSALSGTYQTIQMAKKQYSGAMQIHLLDTKNAAMSEGFIVLEALKALDNHTPLDSVISYLEKLSLSRKQYFMVDSLRLLVKNGRLSGASGFLGSLLKIKPILEVNQEGRIVPYEKVRTQRKALENMVNHVLADLEHIENFVITYNTSDNTEGFEYVKQRIEAVYPNSRSYAAPITPVIGCHTGHGTVGIAYFNLDSLKT